MKNPIVNKRVIGYYNNGCKKLVYVLNDGQWRDALALENVEPPNLWVEFDPYGKFAGVTA